MFFESRCGACGSLGPSPCPDCVIELRRCRFVPAPRGFRTCEALLQFRGPARDLVARIKYRNQRGALDWLAEGMAALVDRADVDVVTWAPTTVGRRRERGFDHGELLARRVARRLGLPIRSLLEPRRGGPLTGLDAADRARTAEFHPRRRLGGRTVLVVDDVVTTGSTLTAAGRALRLAGAGRLHAVAAAHTP